MSRSHGMVAYLDGIRGIAAFLVFVHHFLLAFYSSYFSFDASASHLNGLEIAFGRSVFSVLANGNFWVHVFFVLSGFVLSRRYFHSNDFHELVSALHRRFIRLYIPVAFTLVLAYLLLSAGLFYNKPVSAISHSDWWFGGMWNIPDPANKLLSCLAYGTMFEGDASFDTSMWTLSSEFYGSLFVYAFLMFTHFTKYRFAMLSLAGFYFCSVHATLYLCFIFGISLCHLEQVRNNIRPRTVAIIVATLLPLSLFLGSYPSNHERAGTLYEHLGHTLLHFEGWFHAVGAYFFVLSFVICRPLQRVVSMPLFRFLGYISFSLYLLHALVLGSLSGWVFLRLYTMVGYNYTVLIVFLVTLPVVFMASWLMARYIDEPGIALAKRTYLYIRKRQPRLREEQS